MKKAFIRIVSLCLIAVICIQLVPISANAVSYSGSSSYRSGKYYSALTKVRLTGDQRTDIVNIAKSQIGYQEGSSSSQLSGASYGGRNYTEYGRWYGMQDMWCAMFVSWCANVAGVSTSVVPKHAYTPSGLSWFKNRGQAYSRATVAAGKYTPQAGDIIYFKSARNSNTTNHIGIVTGYSNGKIYTIEGNSSSATISTNGGAVVSKSYSISNTYIVYICKPNYKTSSTASSGSSSSGAQYSGKNNWIPDSVQSIVFNASYYSSKYADLKAAFGTDGNKLYQHYLDYGAKEGRQASAIFDVRTYLNKNADLKAAFGNDYKAAIKHFASHGIKEQRVTAPAVNLGTSFKARINVSTATLNLSLSDTNVIAYTPSDAAAQIWQFDRQSNGTYKITNTKTGQVLDVNGAAKTAGANIQIYDSNNSAAQRWYIYESGVSGKYVFRSACAPGVVMGVQNDSKSAMANIQTVNYTNTKGQRFGITKISSSSTEKPATPPPSTTPTETPVNLGSEFYAKIATSNAANKNLSLSDSNVILYEKSKAAAQTWRFVRQKDGSYVIINQKTGECLAVEGGSSASGTNVRIEKANSSSNQKWFIYSKNGYYMFRPACSTNCVLDVYAASTADLANLQIYEKNNTGAQLFSITKGNYFDLVGPVDVGTGFVARIKNVNSGLNLSLSDNNVIIYTPSDAAAQKYKFDRQSDGSYKLTNQKNNYVLDVAGASSANFTNVQIYSSNSSAAQRWFIYLKEGSYIFRPACASTAVLDVYAGAKDPGTNVDIYEMNNTAAQKFSINKCGATATTGNAYATAEQMEVLRKIMYAVETGGQVYGNARFDDFTEAYTNTPEEHAITIGAGQWYGPEAKKLLNTIRTQYPAVFAALDTAGIANDLDTKNWSTYKLSKGSAKAKCIVKIISSPEGIACQNQLIDEQMVQYLAEARSLGVTEIKAMMMCANLRHLGGLGAVKRVLNKTKGGYTLENIYAALQTDTGNQVGTFRSRNTKVYNWLKNYIG